MIARVLFALAAATNGAAIALQLMEVHNTAWAMIDVFLLVLFSILALCPEETP